MRRSPPTLADASSLQATVMRIGLVTYGLHVGGMETYLFALAHMLRERGDVVSFIVTNSIGEWHQRAKDEGFDTQTVLEPRWGSRQHWVHALAKLLQPFDAVLLNHSRCGQAAAGLLSPTSATISILHNDTDDVYDVGLSNAANVDCVVSISSKVHAEAIRRGFPPERLICIRYGVQVPSAWPKEGSRHDVQRPLMVTFLGRVNHTQKGVLDIPQIVAKAAASGCRLTFHVVGSGESDLATLRQDMARLCPTIDVRYYGALSHTAAMECLLKSDILLMPSRFEGLPITLLEAMASGTIPVASHLPGITDDAVKHGETGFLLPGGNTDAFAGALLQLMNPELRMKMSFAAWRAASDRFSENRMFQEYMSLLDRVVERRRSGTATRSRRIDPSLLGKGWFLPTEPVRLLKSAVSKLLPRQASAGES